MFNTFALVISFNDFLIVSSNVEPAVIISSIFFTAFFVVFLSYRINFFRNSGDVTKIFSVNWLKFSRTGLCSITGNLLTIGKNTANVSPYMWWCGTIEHTLLLLG